MFYWFKRSTLRKFKFIANAGILLVYIVSTIIPVHAQTVSSLPAPGLMISLGTEFAPVRLKAIKVHPDNPFRFDFIVDSGNANLTPKQLEEESKRLIKYFLAAITTPEEDLWVNLSPYEKDKIIPESFGATEMGRDLLAQDYILKQLTASLLYPEKDLGKEFWTKVYAEAKEKYNTTEIPLNTFNKVWIVPEKAVVYENEMTAYVGETRLKVLLEEDYLALSHGLPGSPNSSLKNSETAFKNSDEPQAVNALGSQIIREIIIPALEKDVNTGSNFAPLRQVYHSLILANWYKKRLKDSILAKGYMNKNKVTGIDIDDRTEPQKIYELYVEAFKKGVYNYIKEDVDQATQEIIPRKYFSGGMSWQMITTINLPLALVPSETFVSTPQYTLQAEVVGITNAVASSPVNDEEDSSSKSSAPQKSNKKPKVLSFIVWAKKFPDQVLKRDAKWLKNTFGINEGIRDDILTAIETNQTGRKVRWVSFYKFLEETDPPDTPILINDLKASYKLSEETIVRALELFGWTYSKVEFTPEQNIDKFKRWLEKKPPGYIKNKSNRQLAKESRLSPEIVKAVLGTSEERRNPEETKQLNALRAWARENTGKQGPRIKDLQKQFPKLTEAQILNILTKENVLRVGPVNRDALHSKHTAHISPEEKRDKENVSGKRIYESKEERIEKQQAERAQRATLLYQLENIMKNGQRSIDLEIARQVAKLFEVSEEIMIPSLRNKNEFWNWLQDQLPGDVLESDEVDEWRSTLGLKSHLLIKSVDTEKAVDSRALLLGKLSVIKNVNGSIPEKIIKEIALLFNVPEGRVTPIKENQNEFWEIIQELMRQPDALSRWQDYEIREWEQLFTSTNTDVRSIITPKEPPQRETMIETHEIFELYSELYEARENRTPIDQTLINKVATLLNVPENEIISAKKNNKEFWIWLKNLLNAKNLQESELKNWVDEFVTYPKVSILESNPLNVNQFVIFTKNKIALARQNEGKDKPDIGLIDQLADEFGLLQVEVDFFVFLYRMDPNLPIARAQTLLQNWMSKTIKSGIRLDLERASTLVKLSERELLQPAVENVWTDMEKHLTDIGFEISPVSREDFPIIRPNKIHADVEQPGDAESIALPQTPSQNDNTSKKILDPAVDAVLGQIAANLDVSFENNLEDSLRQYMAKQTGPIIISDNAEMSIAKLADGVSVFVVLHPDFTHKDNPGRDTNAIYAGSKERVAYEIGALGAFNQFVREKNIDITNGLITGLTAWANAAADSSAQTELDQLFVRAHKEGVDNEKQFTDAKAKLNKEQAFRDQESEILRGIFDSTAARKRIESPEDKVQTGVPVSAAPPTVSPKDGDFTRRKHDQEYNLRIRRVLNQIAVQLNLQEDGSGEYPFRDEFTKRGIEEIVLSANSKMYLHADIFGEKILVIIHPGFAGIDHTGRNRNAVYVAREEKAAHEIKELELLKEFARDKGIDISTGLGWGIRAWANDKNIAAADLLERQNILRQLAYDIHQEGLKVESDILGHEYQIIPRKIPKEDHIVANFDWPIAGNSTQTASSSGEKGGIDFNSDNWNLDIREGQQPIILSVDPEKFKDLEFDGLAPVIIRVLPLEDVSVFLGLNDSPPEEHVSLITH